MKLKLIIFLSINLAIALLAAVASPALISGPEYRRYKVAFDFVEQLQPGERVDVILTQTFDSLGSSPDLALDMIDAMP